MARITVDTDSVDRLKRLLSGRNLVHVATVMPDGSPQVTPVWANWADGAIMVNTAEGRTKHRNVLRDNRVAVSITSTDDPLQMVSVRGVVEEIIPDYDYKYADILTRQYMPGRNKYPFRRPGERRTTFRIRPVSVYVMPEIRAESGD